MSCTHCIEALAPYRRENGTGGPTNTFTVQRRFAQRLRGVLSRINARIREAIDENDLFDLRGEALEDVEDVPEDTFNFPTSQAKVAGFLAWLRDQLDSGFLGVVGPDSNEFVRQAYATGLRNAQRNLSDLDIAFESEAIDDILSRPIHRTALQTLYTRTYENLVSVRDDVAQAVRDELVTGLTEGENPREIGRTLTDRVDSIGKHRATMIARSETINAHSEATLNQYEQTRDDADVDIGLQHGDWQATQDTQTCPFCRRLSGETLTFREMRNTAVQFRGQVYRLKPPAHPNGRCTILPALGVDPGSLDPLEERVPGNVIS